MENLNNPTNHLTIYAIILLVIGLTLRYIISKRRFNRRGIAGMQYFKSYSVALVTTIIERIVNFIAALMIIGAIILFLIR
ncbi:MAG: molybdenum ABC transporter permease [Mucilaginibacter sp.]